MSSEQERLRMGLIGLGNMGSVHAREILNGRVSHAELTAVADVDPSALAPFPDVQHFSDSAALIRSGSVDAVIIATPHYDHTPISVDALGRGLHVLCEKPLAVHKADCELMLEAYRRRPDPDQIFAEMFNQRTDPRYQRLRALVQNGELGEIQRVTWIITDWFRTEAYYRSGGWRATWGGEGGGVLLNQCPHHLDLWQWLFGMPERVRAFCGFGRFHEIEVEDQVTAYFEYASGATGVFIASTGEAPGTNRLEVAAERGRVVIESPVTGANVPGGDGLSFIRNEVPVSEFSRSSRERFAAPPVWHVQIPVSGSGAQHLGILQNFVNAIVAGEPLIAPAVEGIHSVELANAMIQSSLQGETVTLPLDANAYAAELEGLIRDSSAADAQKISPRTVRKTTSSGT
jgi:predicted dehydrogenase